MQLQSASLVQIPLSAQPGKGTQLSLGCLNKAPGGLWVEIVETQWLASGEWDQREVWEKKIWYDF